MTCEPEMAQRISLALDGELAAPAGALLRDHLATCERCVAYHDRLLVLRGLLRADDGPAPDLLGAVRATVGIERTIGPGPASHGADGSDDEEVTVVEPMPLPEPIEEARHRRRPRWLAAVASGAAAALVAGALGVVALRAGGEEDGGDDTVRVATLTPADVAELRAAFEELGRIIFDGSAEVTDLKLSVVVDGERLRELVTPIAQQNASVYERMSAEIVDVRAAGIDRAEVGFRILYDGQPYTFPLDGDGQGARDLAVEAVRVDGAWKYTLESICHVLDAFGFGCPPEVIDPAYRDVTASPDGQSVVAVVEGFLAPGTPVDERVALVEDGERLREPFAAVVSLLDGYGPETSVGQVLVSPNRPRAVVRFSVALGGTPVLEVTGDAVPGPDGWRLGHRTACEVLGMAVMIGAGIDVDCAPAPGTAWADEPDPSVDVIGVPEPLPVAPEVEAAVRPVVEGLLDGRTERADLARVDRSSPLGPDPLDDEQALAVLDAFAATVAGADARVGPVTHAMWTMAPGTAASVQVEVEIDRTGQGREPERFGTTIVLWRPEGSEVWQTSLASFCVITEELGGDCPIPGFDTPPFGLDPVAPTEEP
ncbi:MAG: zf-HC2 domain-containing protein [Acidimicrobiia bacterium]|nr:zf-HC2 domain-containing protein [Acidimicrobiia bacterium]